MNQIKKYILYFVLPVATGLAIFFVFFPYFNSDFANTRAEQARIENEQRLAIDEAARIEAWKKAEEERQMKDYLMGKFDPAKRADFSLIPKEYTFYEEGKGDMYLRTEALQAYLQMQSAAMSNSVDLKIVSATRNFAYQKNIWDRKWAGLTLVEGMNLKEAIPDPFARFAKILEYSAAPGTSRHHFGTEIDINGVNPPYFNSEKGKKEYAWLVENAASFGFCQTYNAKTEGRVAGYEEEKWHWSYLPLARDFTEQYKTLIRQEDIKGFLGEEQVPSFDLINNYVLSINPDCL